MFFLVMGGYVVQLNSQPEGPPHKVCPDTLLEMFQNKTLPWPKLSDDEINDKSKADWTIKSLAIIQILWFATQMIGRWVQGLGTTTLELFTLGIVISAVVTYICYWEKPFDIQVPVVIHAEASVRLRQRDCSGCVGFSIRENDSTWSLYVEIAICLVFGALHIAAWNFHFPSFTEQLLWRVSSVGVTAIPVLLLVLLEGILEGRLHESLFWVGASMYTLFRLYMFVEMFASLRAVPASVYQTPQWSQYFPSFG
jgi:hypothetical protein